MPYTLVKGLLWVVLALLIGVLIGWLLRSLKSRRQIARSERVAERDRFDPARPATPSDSSSWQPLASEPPPPSDVRSAAAVLGREIELDDLCVVVGVSPAIESLCRRIGIRTWWDLATTEPSLLRTMLTDAGLGIAVDDSASWPLQARLLAEGRWAEFKALTEEPP